MTISRGGLIYGPMLHHLDHMAPFCELMSLPLVVTEEQLLDEAKNTYPNLEVIYWSYLEVGEKLISQFDLIFTTLPRPLFDDAFFLVQHLHKKKIQTVWLPHGNSDKGHSSYLMEGLKHDTQALLYGPKMAQFLDEKGAFEQLQDPIFIGNFRYQHYLKHQNHYDTLVQKTIPLEQPIILYAPTWQDSENSSSFLDAAPHLIEKLPPGYTLVIKLHPNLSDWESEKVLYRYHNLPHLFFLRHFTPIYPLLEKTSIYIGDMSSIGYDFLLYNRPMFFLNQNRRDPLNDPGLYLHRCGISVNPCQYTNIYDIIQENLPMDQSLFSQTRAQVYAHTFGEPRDWNEIKPSILSCHVCKAV